MSDVSLSRPPLKPTQQVEPDEQLKQATAFLSKYIGKTLRITVTDSRCFVGQMKCTDKDCNIILALTQEYRPPSNTVVKAAASNGSQVEYTSRYVGLVVVPGEHIIKIEHEEYIGKQRAVQ